MRPPVIDGVVDDAVWNNAPPFSAFIQQEPNEGEPASERTEIRFLLDRQTLYVSLLCFDTEPQNILVSQSRRDADLGDTDSVRILLDTFNDGQNAFVFGTNPFGIEYDGQVMAEGQTGQSGSGGAGFNVNWDADWTVRARTTARGWEAEFAIPLKTLRYNPGDERTWGVNAMRNIRRKNEQVFLSPVPRGYNLYRVSVAGKLNGLALPARRDLRFIPYVAGAVNDDKTLGTDTVRRDADAGLDMKWGVRADLTLDLTVNTDFAQVEADEQQVNLTRFPLFFAEKRPFFLENAQLFQLGQPQAIDLFFSRRIGLLPSGEPVDIMGGARLSGKLGGFNVGMLNMQTESAVIGAPEPPWLPPITLRCCACNVSSADRTLARCTSAARGSARAPPLTISIAPTASISAGRRRATVGCSRFSRERSHRRARAAPTTPAAPAYTYTHPSWTTRRRLRAGRRRIQS